MKQIDFLRTFSLTLPKVTEEPHFEKTFFRVKKKIFVTYDATNNLACFKFYLLIKIVFLGIKDMRICIKNHEDNIGFSGKINLRGYGTDWGKDQKPIDQRGIESIDNWY